MKVLPRDFDRLLDLAVEAFWSQRESHGPTGQEGGRGKVLSGHNMRGFAHLVLEVARHAGLPPSPCSPSFGVPPMPTVIASSASD